MSEEMQGPKKKTDLPEPADSRPPEKRESRPDKTDESGQPEVDRDVRKLPPPVRKTIEMAMMQSFSSGPFPHPLFDKFDESHIHKFLDYSQEDDRNRFRIRCTNRWFALAYVALAIAAFVFLVIYLLPANKDMLLDILKLFIAFVGGFGGGFGLKTYLDKKE